MVADRAAGRLAGPVVVDASAVVDYLVVSTLTDAATRLFRMAADDRVDLWAPDLVFAECASALRKLVRLEVLPAAAARRAMEHLPHLPITATGTSALMPAVWKMHTFLTSYDACYVALADALEATFVTGERKLVVELRKRRRRAHFLGDL